MKKLFLGALLLFMLQGTASAVGVWYRPTPYPFSVTNGVHIVDGWLSNVYYQSFVQDDALVVGKAGEVYRTYFKFDLVGLPQNVSTAAVYFYQYEYDPGLPEVDVSFFFLGGPWDTTLTWDTQPWASWIGWRSAPTYSGGPFVDRWGTDVTQWYTGWQDGTYDNFGMMLEPWSAPATGALDTFRSSRYNNPDQRPSLWLTFTPPVPVPDFKLPLPGDIYWLVTTEVGGWDCKSDYDVFHDGANYFSIDFSWRGKDFVGNLVYPNPDPDNDPNTDDGVNIPVIAAAAGKVVFATDEADPYNGHYVVIDHDGDGDLGTGFQTRYLHLQEPGPKTRTGRNVKQGDLLGYMGNTGLSSGPHLHFGIRFANDGSSQSNGQYVVMDGQLLKGFQTECEAGDWNRYYLSTNKTYRVR